MQRQTVGCCKGLFIITNSWFRFPCGEIYFVGSSISHLFEHGRTLGISDLNVREFSVGTASHPITLLSLRVLVYVPWLSLQDKHPTTERIKPLCLPGGRMKL